MIGDAKQVQVANIIAFLCGGVEDFGERRNLGSHMECSLSSGVIIDTVESPETGCIYMPRLERSLRRERRSTNNSTSSNTKETRGVVVES